MAAVGAVAGAAPGEDVRFAALGDGRRVAYRVFGAVDGLPVLALHGTPGSRVKFELAEAEALAAGVRLIAPDRWGYGLTDTHPRPTLAAFGADLADFTRVIGVDRFAVMGISGGGPFAAAVAVAAPNRVTALALVAPVGPIAGTPHGLALSPFHLLAFRVLAHMPGAIRLPFAGFGWLLQRNARLAMALAHLRAPRVDRSTACGPREKSSLVAAFRAGLAPGADGPVIDMRIFGSRWGLDLAGYGGPARVWIGTADRHVPIPAARHLAERLGRGTLTVLDAEGHYWVLRHVDQVLDWIVRETKGATNAAPGRNCNSDRGQPG